MRACEGVDVKQLVRAVMARRILRLLTNVSCSSSLEVVRHEENVDDEKRDPSGQCSQCGV